MEQQAPQSVRACPFCMTTVPGTARVCSGCRASCRKPGGKWHSYRDAMRTDVFVGVLGAMVVLGLLGGLLSILIASSSRSTRSTFTTCTSSHPDYPFC